MGPCRYYPGTHMYIPHKDIYIYSTHHKYMACLQVVICFRGFKFKLVLLVPLVPEAMSRPEATHRPVLTPFHSRSASRGFGSRVDPSRPHLQTLSSELPSFHSFHPTLRRQAFRPSHRHLRLLALLGHCTRPSAAATSSRGSAPNPILNARAAGIVQLDAVRRTAHVA